MFRRAFVCLGSLPVRREAFYGLAYPQGGHYVASTVVFVSNSLTNRRTVFACSVDTFAIGEQLVAN